MEQQITLINYQQCTNNPHVQDLILQQLTKGVELIASTKRIGQYLTNCRYGVIQY